MGLRIGEMIISGAELQGENPQPYFRAAEQNVTYRKDESLRKKDFEGYGVACGERYLPYRMQDRYTRARKPMKIKTFILENEHLIATFIPTLGGKLWSLYSIDEQRELLFVNKVIQPANLAIRNAWTSGGIEWNLGHLGHSVFTCESLHCVLMEDEKKEQFLRMYEYEAIEKQVFQMDFHLPRGARQLGVHVRLENTLSKAAPIYWWTNTAVKLTQHTRVFSGTKEIIYQLPPDKQLNTYGFGRCEMPYQPTLPNVDISYPWRIPFSAEYFFQNSRDCLPWEVSIEHDAKGFCERSTQPLFSRKMFCWGTGAGGRNWCSYLSEQNEGDYIEIQAGLSPTQNHTAEIKANGTISFTQMFGAFTAQSSAAKGSWINEAIGVEERLNNAIPQKYLLSEHARYSRLATLEGGKPLHRASGYGGMERQRRIKASEQSFALHLQFDAPEKGDALYDWLMLLNGTPLSDTALPIQYAPGGEWLPVLKESIRNGANNKQTLFQQAVLLVEGDEEMAARDIFQKLLMQSCPFAAHALGSLEKRAGNMSQAAEYYVKAYELEKATLDSSFAESAMDSLIKIGKAQAAWNIYEEIALEKHSEAQDLLALEAALQLDKLDFVKTAFTREYASIREGSVGLTNMWLEYQRRILRAGNKLNFTEDKTYLSITVPPQLDFRMR